MPLPFFCGLSQTDRDKRTVSLYTQSDRHRQKNFQPVHSVRQTQTEEPSVCTLSQTDTDRRTVSLYTQSDRHRRKNRQSVHSDRHRQRQKNRQSVHSVRQTQTEEPSACTLSQTDTDRQKQPARRQELLACTCEMSHKNKINSSSSSNNNNNKYCCTLLLL